MTFIIFHHFTELYEYLLCDYDHIWKFIADNYIGNYIGNHDDIQLMIKDIISTDKNLKKYIPSYFNQDGSENNDPKFKIFKNI